MTFLIFSMQQAAYLSFPLPQKRHMTCDFGNLFANGQDRSRLLVWANPRICSGTAFDAVNTPTEGARPKINHATGSFACCGGETAEASRRKAEAAKPAPEKAAPAKIGLFDAATLKVEALKVALVPSPAEMQKALGNAGLRVS